MTKTPPKELIENWKHMDKLHRDMASTVMQLMSHKDTDKEDLWQAHLNYVKKMQDFYAMRDHLRKHFPSTGYFTKAYPWG